jgi:large subunit ribosomal protein L18
MKTRNECRVRRHRRLRTKLRGTAERPRLCVYRSNKHIYVQLVDDHAGRTLCSVSTKTAAVAGRVAGLKGVERAKVVGETIGELAGGHNIKRVVFDRGGFTYTGQVKALADAARAKGLAF